MRAGKCKLEGSKKTKNEFREMQADKTKIVHLKGAREKTRTEGMPRPKKVFVNSIS
jgi:hypothetical protein